MATDRRGQALVELAVGMLVVSNLIMLYAWYGHLKLQEMK